MKIEIVRDMIDRDIEFEVVQDIEFGVIKRDYCCEELETNPAITLTNFDDEDGRIPMMCINQSLLETCGDDDIYEFRKYPIKFCPFCGEPIDIKIFRGQHLLDKIY